MLRSFAECGPGVQQPCNVSFAQCRVLGHALQGALGPGLPNAVPDMCDVSLGRECLVGACEPWRRWGARDEVVCAWF